LSRTLELEPDNYQAHIDIANLLIAAADFKQAKEHTDWLSNNRPNDPDVHSLVAAWYAGQSDTKSATAELQKAIALDPNRWEPYLNLGMLQQKSNQPELAEINLKKAVQVGDKNASTHLALATFYQMARRFSESEQQLQQAISIDPQNPDPRAA